MENGVSDRRVYISVCICEKDMESFAFCSLVCCFMMLLSLLDWSEFYMCLCSHLSGVLKGVYLVDLVPPVARLLSTCPPA